MSLDKESETEGVLTMRATDPKTHKRLHKTLSNHKKQGGCKFSRDSSSSKLQTIQKQNKQLFCCQFVSSRRIRA